MADKFLVKNGWLGLKRNGSYYFYNSVDKQFEIFQAENLIEGNENQRLHPINILPTPDFAYEASAAALTLTTKCNMDCSYCYVKPVPYSAEMNCEEVAEAVCALGEQTKREMILFAWGGEPTQNPKGLLTMIRTAERYSHIKIALITNGVMENNLLQELLTFKNVAFQLSFDGITNQNKQKQLLTKANSLTRMLNSLETITQISHRVSLRSTVTRSNIHEVKASLLQVARQFTNRIMIEHLHTYNGRAVNLKKEVPPINEYVDLIFDTVPIAEREGIHVKVLPFDHLRAGGPNNQMTFLNVLPGKDVVVTNAIIHSSHPFFSKFSIGRISDGRIVYDLEKNILLSSRYLKNYYQQCQDCFARPVCRGSVQRYLFISNDGLDEWDNMRCQYFMAVLERWMEMLVGEIVEYMKKLNALEGTIQLVAPLGKVHYPMFVMKEGLSLSYSPFSK